jgi:hypothetical protein
VVVTGSDAKAKKVESWSDAQGNRAALYPNKTVCACQSVQERKLIQQFKAAWQVNKVHFGVDRNPEAHQAQPQRQQQQQQEATEVMMRPARARCDLDLFKLTPISGVQEGWGVGKFFKKIADTVEKAAALPTTVIKVRPSVVTPRVRLAG